MIIIISANKNTYGNTTYTIRHIKDRISCRDFGYCDDMDTHTRDYLRYPENDSQLYINARVVHIDVSHSNDIHSIQR